MDRILVGLPMETFPGEWRVAPVPPAIPVIAKTGMNVIVEHGAGETAGSRDAAYERNGATIGSRADALLRRGIDVRFAMHPVAGRMPGHMNVLMAEANVPYDLLYDLESINPELLQTDTVVVVGANGVVIPAARTDEHTPIFGMPIPDADQAKWVSVVKRSMRWGFAGVDDELFYLDKKQMLFGDTKQVIGEVVEGLSKLPAREVATV